MFWKLTCEPHDAPGDARPWDGRFVLHRHQDIGGAHLDLRLEQDGYLLGWRIAPATLDGEPWATEKAPHPCRWLEQDGDAVREDAGLYAWLERSENQRAVLLAGRQGTRVVRAARLTSLTAETARSVADALALCGSDGAEAGRLIQDGVTARRRAVARLHGLGRELDGSAFDEAVWRKALEGLSLDEIHAHLRAYEVRFDQAHPPTPVSRPEVLPAREAGGAGGLALTIAREG